MTIRDIAISFGYEVDKKTESKAKESIKALKDTAAKALGAIGIGFSIGTILSAVKSIGAVSEALNEVKEDWAEIGKEMEEAIGLTAMIVSGIKKLSAAGIDFARRMIPRLSSIVKQLGGMKNVLKILAAVGGSILAAMNLSKIASGLGTVLNLIKGIRASTLLLAAVFIVIALLIEDFVAFMQGNDSLLGEALKRAGIDCDALREKIRATWDKIKSFLLSAWKTIQSACSKVWGSIRDFFSKHGDQIKSKLAAAWSAIKAILSGSWNALKKVATAVFGGLQAFWDKHGEQIKASLINIWNGIRARLTAAWNLLKSTATTIFNSLKAFWDTWGSTITTIFRSAWDNIKAVLGTAFDVLTDLFAIFSDLFSGNWSQLWEDIKTYFRDVWSGIFSILQTVLTSIWNVISNIFKTIWGFISTTAHNIWDYITTAFLNILTGVTSTTSNIKNAIINGLKAAIDWVKALPGQAFQWGRDIIMGIVNGIKGAAGAVGDAVKGVADKIKGFLGFSEPDEGPLSDFHTYMPDMIDLMAKGIRTGKKKVEGAVSDLADGMSVNVTPDAPLPGGKPPKGSAAPTSSRSPAVSIIGAAAKAIDKNREGIRGALGTLMSGVSAFTQAAKPSMSTTNNATTNSSNVSKVIHFKSEIHQEFNGERAAQKNVAKAADSAAEDTTSALARALAYAGG